MYLQKQNDHSNFEVTVLLLHWFVQLYAFLLSHVEQSEAEALHLINLNWKLQRTALIEL